MKKARIQAVAFIVITLFVGCASSGSSASRTDEGSLAAGENRTGNNSGAVPAEQGGPDTGEAAATRPEAAPDTVTKTDAELVREAVERGDCAFLYAFIQKDGSARDLVTLANNAVKRYAVLDASTGKYRTGKMEARIRRVPEEFMERVFVDPETALPGVVSSLTNDTPDRFLKAKTIHDWICDNIAYDTGMYFSGRTSAQDYASVLKKKLAVCSGYTNLFNEMCRLAGLESIGIHGYSKGFGYTGKIGNRTDHAWNAVHIGNKWYLVDVTWDAGHVDQRTYIKEYSSGWLFLDSRPFLYSHLPEDAAYQYYAPVLTADDFTREPYIAGDFFQYGLSLKTDKPEYNNVINGAFSFDIGLANANVAVSSMLRTPWQEDIDAASWANRKGSVITAEFDTPDAAAYKGHVFARYNNEVRLQEKVDAAVFERDWLPRAEQLFADDTLPNNKKITEAELNLFKRSYFKVPENNSYYFAEDQFDTARNNAVLKIHLLLDLSTTYMDNVFSFNIKADSGYDGFGAGVLKYPHTFTTYNHLPDTALLSPVTGTLKAGSTETFVVSSTDYSSFAIILDGEWNFFTGNSETGNFELEFTVPPGVDSIRISGASSKNATHWALVQYDVVQ